jgi:hypothetical protein
MKNNSLLLEQVLLALLQEKMGDIDWLVKYQNKEVHDSYHEFISRIDAMRIGRGTLKSYYVSSMAPEKKSLC